MDSKIAPFPFIFLPVRQGEVLNEVEVLQAHEVELVVCDFFSPIIVCNDCSNAHNS